MTTEKKERALPRPSCTDHATCCNRHFSGLGAFDSHFVDGICTDPSEIVGRAGVHKGLPLLQVWTESGICDKLRGCWKDGKRLHYAGGVTVWQRYVTVELQASREAAWESSTEPRAPQMGLPYAHGRRGKIKGAAPLDVGPPRDIQE